MELETIAAIGPRAFTPDLVTPEMRKEFRSPVFRTFLENAAKVARRFVGGMHAQMRAVARDNERTEFKACNDLGTLHARIPADVYFYMRGIYGDDCWSDPEFMEAFLRDNRQCRVKTTRGTRGQEYGGGTRTRTSTRE